MVMKNKHYVVIMAGGTGTRLWPLSRKQLPKQFLKIIDDQSQLKKTVINVEKLIPKEDIFIMADSERTEMAQKQLPDHPTENFLIEPEARDNGPAIALASAILNHRSPGCTVTILWSDHLVRKTDKFVSVLKTAFNVVDENPNYMVSIGIKPTRPATEFGYIKVGHEFNNQGEEPVYTVEQFVEKPDLETANKYISDWKYLWNTGYKIYKAQHMLNLFAKHQPDFYATLQKIAASFGSSEELAITRKEFGELEKRDIERLITEKEDKILVIPADLGWSDIGAWNTVHEVLAEQNNHHLVVKGNHIGINDENCLVFGNSKLIATVGLKDIVIVETDDAILVAHKDAAQDVKAITDQLKEQGKHLYL